MACRIFLQMTLRACKVQVLVDPYERVIRYCRRSTFGILVRFVL